VSRQVSLEEKAINQAAGFLADDPNGLRTVLAAIDRLTDHPYPDESFPFGSSGLHRHEPSPSSGSRAWSTNPPPGVPAADISPP
jgi:hypothetical protein